MSECARIKQKENDGMKNGRLTEKELEEEYERLQPRKEKK